MLFELDLDADSGVECIGTREGSNIIESAPDVGWVQTAFNESRGTD